MKRFLVRWFVCVLGLWIAVSLLGEDNIKIDGSLWAVVGAGLVLALVNVVIKPILVILSLPVIIFTLGLFMIVVNGLLLLITAKLYGPLEVHNIWAAMVAGMVIGLVNYLVTRIMEDS